MVTFIIIYAIITIASFILAISDVTYYDKKMPNKTLEEINEIISECNEQLNHEENVVKQSRILDTREYWEQQREKLINYHKEHGIPYEISRLKTKTY